MSFKLSEQLDADAVSAFTLYKKYIENFRYKFPESVFDVIENEDWSGGYDSNSPHDSNLKAVVVDGVGTEDNSIKIILSKPHKGLEIEITYKGIFNSELPGLGDLSEESEWRYEQFRYFDPYHSHGIKGVKMFTHDIEWVGGVIWRITAKNVAVEWKKA